VAEESLCALVYGPKAVSSSSSSTSSSTTRTTMPIPPQAPLEPPFHPTQQPRHQSSSIQERGAKRPRLLLNTGPEAPTTAQSGVAYAAGDIVRVVSHERAPGSKGVLWTTRRYDAEEVTYTVKLRSQERRSGVDGMAL
jgi:hypothetical protein